MDLQAHMARASLHGGAEADVTKVATRGPRGPRGPERRASRQVLLVERLSKTKDQAAFKFLFRETSLDSICLCLAKVRDQEISLYLQRGILQIASLMSSEAFTGIERVRRGLRTLQMRMSDDPSTTRRLYDRHVESLGRSVFAIGRRLGQIEDYLAGCPFSGSAEETRGLYGQRVRDLAGDVRFLRFELARWVQKFVPIRGELPAGAEGHTFLEGRIGAVVDDLGLRLREIQEVLSASLLNQLIIFDEDLTRSKLFKRDIENFLDFDHLVNWLSELVTRVESYDEQRRPGELKKIKTLLRDFQPEPFPTFSGVRESDHILLARFVPQIINYRHRPTGRADDPIHVFLLLLGDLLLRLNRTGTATSEIGG